MRTKTCINLSIILALFASNLYAAESNYYRYKDKDGHTIITNTLPPDVVNEGYEVISPRGNIVETVTPAKSKEALLKEADDEKQRIKEQQEAQVQTHKDEILLKSYNTQEDIERARDEKINSIQVLEGIVHETLSGIKKQLNDAKSMATTFENSGQKIPENLLKTITESERQIKENEGFLSKKEEEKSEVRLKYQQLLDRFHEIKVRRSMGETTSKTTPTATQTTTTPAAATPATATPATETTEVPTSSTSTPTSTTTSSPSTPTP